MDLVDTKDEVHLFLGVVDGKPLHVAIAYDAKTGDCYIITVYFPDPSIWGEDFRTRRHS